MFVSLLFRHFDHEVATVSGSLWTSCFCRIRIGIRIGNWISTRMSLPPSDTLARALLSFSPLRPHCHDHNHQTLQQTYPHQTPAHASRQDANNPWRQTGACLANRLQSESFAKPSRLQNQARLCQARFPDTNDSCFIENNL